MISFNLIEVLSLSLSLSLLNLLLKGKTNRKALVYFFYRSNSLNLSTRIHIIALYYFLGIYFILHKFLLQRRSPNDLHSGGLRILMCLLINLSVQVNDANLNSCEAYWLSLKTPSTRLIKLNFFHSTWEIDQLYICSRIQKWNRRCQRKGQEITMDIDIITSRLKLKTI